MLLCPLCIHFIHTTLAILPASWPLHVLKLPRGAVTQLTFASCVSLGKQCLPAGRGPSSLSWNPISFSAFPSPHDRAHVSVNYFIVHMEQLCPELSVIMNMVYVHIIQYGSLWAPSGYWTPETWLRDQRTDLLILLSVN